MGMKAEYLSDKRRRAVGGNLEEEGGHRKSTKKVRRGRKKSKRKKGIINKVSYPRKKSTRKEKKKRVIKTLTLKKHKEGAERRVNIGKEKSITCRSGESRIHKREKTEKRKTTKD